MKVSRILSVAGVVTLLACGAALAQAPQIPVGAGVGVHRQPPGSRFREHAHHHHPAAAARAVSHSCSQQADAKGLRGKARKAFHSKCRKSGGR